MNWEGWLLTVGQIVLVLGFSPFLVGLIKKVKAHLQCRQGASMFQPYADLTKLFRKEVVYSETSSWIFTATPYILFSSTLAASLLIPTIFTPLPLNFAGNLIALVYLLALGTFFLILAGMDAGSAFGGMGSSREAMIASLTEPALLLSLFAVALTSGSANLSTIVYKTALLQDIVLDPPPHLMALVALWMVTAAETGRVPVDNPSTHLELTMIHEAMILEYSGRYLALVEWAAGIKLMIFLSLVANLFAPWGIATSFTPGALGIGLLVYLGKVMGLAVIIAFLESMLAKLRLFRVTEFLGVAFILSVLAVVFFYILRVE